MRSFRLWLACCWFLGSAFTFHVLLVLVCCNVFSCGSSGGKLYFECRRAEMINWMSLIWNIIKRGCRLKYHNNYDDNNYDNTLSIIIIYNIQWYILWYPSFPTSTIFMPPLSQSTLPPQGRWKNCAAVPPSGVGDTSRNHGDDRSEALINLCSTIISSFLLEEMEEKHHERWKMGRFCKRLGQSHDPFDSHATKGCFRTGKMKIYEKQKKYLYIIP